jgi:hypothetical protein
MQTGFKEWQVVCDALAQGRQTVILRKGGIHEGRDGFSFAHDRFFLFPTRYHVQPDQVREGAPEALPEWKEGDLVRIRHLVHIPTALTLTDWQSVETLEPFHIYTPQTVRERFDWEGRGMSSGSIHVALAEVWQLAQAWEFCYEKRMGGCRSWIELPEPAEGILENATRVTSPLFEAARLGLQAAGEVLTDRP